MRVKVDFFIDREMALICFYAFKTLGIVPTLKQIKKSCLSGLEAEGMLFSVEPNFVKNENFEFTAQFYHDCDEEFESLFKKYWP